MPTFQGSIAAPPGHVPYLDVTVRSRTATQAVVRYVFRTTPVAGATTTGTFTGTLKVNSSSYAMSGAVSGGVNNTIWSRDITYKTSAAFTLNVSVTGSIPGSTGWKSTSLSGSMSVPAGTAKLTPVTGFQLAGRTSDTGNEVTFGWNPKSGATSYVLRYRRDGGAWSDAATGLTGTSNTRTLLTDDSQYEYNVRAVNAAGRSDASDYATVWTIPVKPPQPTVTSVTGGTEIKVAKGANQYLFGLEVERNNDGTVYAGTNLSSGSGVGGAVSSIIDTRGVAPVTQWRVRRFLGEASAPHRVYGPWSEWSESSMAASYRPPQVTKLVARRCDSGGNLTETGKYAKVTFSGTVSSVFDGGVETNWLTRKIGYRKHKTKDAWTETVITNQGSPNPWTDATVIIGGNSLAETDAWDIRATLQDNYSGVVTQQVTVPVSQVAFSIGASGIGAGKAWERGALDVAGDAHIAGALTLNGFDVAKQPIFLTVPGVAIATGEAVGGTITASAPTFPTGKNWSDYQPVYTLVGLKDSNITERFVVNIRSYTASGLKFSYKKLATGVVAAADWQIMVTLLPLF